MKIELTRSHRFNTIVVENTNVKIEYSATDSIKKDNNLGQPYFEQDISDESLNLFSGVLEDLIFYREREFDSSTLITNLFSKLPQEKTQSLLKELNDDYLEEVE